VARKNISVLLTDRHTQHVQTSFYAVSMTLTVTNNFPFLRHVAVSIVVDQ